MTQPHLSSDNETRAPQVRVSGRIKRLAATVSYVGLSRASIYRLVKCGAFPAPLKLGANSVGWDVDDLDAWIDARKHEPAKH